MYDPCRVVYEALEDAYCDPHGPYYQFRARCPAHDGENEHALSVGEGMDGRAVLHCHARQCTTKEITAALGMRMSELFPDHHHRAPKSRCPPRVRRADPLVAILGAMTTAGLSYDWGRSPGFFIGERCPSCGFEDFWIYKGGDNVYLACWSGCPPSAIINALTMTVPNGRPKSDIHSLYVADTEREY